MFITLHPSFQPNYKPNTPSNMAYTHPFAGHPSNTITSNSGDTQSITTTHHFPHIPPPHTHTLTPHQLPINSLFCHNFFHRLSATTILVVMMTIFTGTPAFSQNYYYYSMDWNTENTKWYELPSCYENTVYRITKTGADPNGTSHIFFSIPDDIPDGCHIEVTLRSNNLNLRGNNNGDNIQVYDATIDGDGIHSGTNRYDNTGSNPNGWRQTNRNQPTPETISIGTSRGVIIYFINNNNNNSTFEIEVGCKGCEPPHTGDDIIMNQASQEIAIECGKYYWFYDSGGPTGNYNRNQNYTYTFTSTGQIYIRFFDFNTENGNDWMTIRDATANTVLANQQSGNGTLVDYVFNTEAAGNNMSIQWRSNNNNTNRSGWRAIIWAEGCPDPTCTTTPQFTNCPASLMSGQTWNPIYWNTTATPTGWTTSNATYSGGTVTAGATIGSASVSATVAESLPYCAGTMTCNFNVTCNNTNTLTVTSPIEVTVGGSSVDIDDYITANSSGGTPTFSTSSGNITLNTTTGVVTGVTAGDATVRVTVPQKTTGGITYCEKYVDITIHVVEPDDDGCEGFESGTLHGWTSEGDNEWEVGVGDYSTTTGTHSGSYNALITHAANDNQTYLISPVMDLSGSNGAILSFWYVNRSWYGDIDGLDVYYRINGGAWQGPIFSTTEAHSTWTEASVVLPDLAANYQIGFMMTDNYGYGVGLDDICIKECTPSTATLEFSPDNGTVNIGNTIDLRSPTLTNTTGRPEQWSINGSGASFVAQGVVQGFDEGNVTITVSVPSWMDGSTLYCPMEATYSLEIIDPACDHTIILDDNKTQTIECGETYCFYDSGRKTGNYSDNEDFTLTLTSTGTIHINFSEFETESASWDTLCFSGTDNDGKYGGTTIPSEFVSTGNQVVIHWQSDGSNTYSGWKATITAEGCCTPREGAAHITNTCPIDVPYGSTVPLNGTVDVGGGDVSWTSNNTGVATVDGNGLVSPSGIGSTTITYTRAKDGNYCETSSTCTINVTVPTPTVTQTDDPLPQCNDGDATLVATVTSIPPGYTFHWYRNSACTDEITSDVSGTNHENLNYDADGGQVWCRLEKPESTDERTFIYNGTTSGSTAGTDGSVQTYTIPEDATSLTLEVWGAQGGSYNDTYVGGRGGYSKGTLTSPSGGSTLYVVVGGQPGSVTSTSGGTAVNGGYNGGGAAVVHNYNGGYSVPQGGGGATHIATVSGVLRDLSTQQDNVLVVAGGGSGGVYYYNHNTSTDGGGTGYAGGGATSDGFSGGTYTYTANQTTSGNGGYFGQGARYTGNTNYRYGPAGGGGGWYGGGNRQYADDTYNAELVLGHGGGSGYVKGTLSDPVNNTGGRDGNGQAKITAYFPKVTGPAGTVTIQCCGLNATIEFGD